MISGTGWFEFHFSWLGKTWKTFYCGRFIYEWGGGGRERDCSSMCHIAGSFYIKFMNAEVLQLIEQGVVFLLDFLVRSNQ